MVFLESQLVFMEQQSGRFFFVVVFIFYFSNTLNQAYSAKHSKGPATLDSLLAKALISKLA